MAAFAQVVRAAPVTLLRRRSDGAGLMALGEGTVCDYAPPEACAAVITGTRPSCQEPRHDHRRLQGRRAAGDAEAFYAIACDPRRSVMVEACAGAGKTWMLVSRILRALLDGVQPHGLLAITFTRKAAGEMRERLSECLREFGAPQTADAARVEARRQRGLRRSTHSVSHRDCFERAWAALFAGGVSPSLVLKMLPALKVGAVATAASPRSTDTSATRLGQACTASSNGPGRRRTSPTPISRR